MFLSLQEFSYETGARSTVTSNSQSWLHRGPISTKKKLKVLIVSGK
jgi:hypothetical protein